MGWLFERQFLVFDVRRGERAGQPSVPYPDVLCAGRASCELPVGISQDNAEVVY